MIIFCRCIEDSLLRHLESEEVGLRRGDRPVQPGATWPLFTQHKTSGCATQLGARATAKSGFSKKYVYTQIKTWTQPVPESRSLPRPLLNTSHVSAMTQGQEIS